MREPNDAGDLLKAINSDLFSPKRFMIASLLYAFGRVKLSELRAMLNLSWGDLDSNVKRLVEKGYVELWKEPGRVRGLETVAYLTEKGKREYEKLAETLRILSEKLEGKPP